MFLPSCYARTLVAGVGNMTSRREFAVSLTIKNEFRRRNENGGQKKTPKVTPSRLSGDEAAYSGLFALTKKAYPWGSQKEKS